MPARLLFFVNVPAILRDISDKLSILKKHLNAHSGFTYSYFMPILQFTIEGPIAKLSPSSSFGLTELALLSLYYHPPTQPPTRISFKYDFIYEPKHSN